MSPTLPSRRPVEAAARAALREACARVRGLRPTPRAMVVSVEAQRLFLLENDALIADFPVSTAAAGVGGQEGSLRTPPGLHRVREKIGAGEPAGRVFVERLPTGRIWGGEPADADLILTRLLTLEGLEPGLNRGPGCDSLGRFIYIHGTNHEERLGAPASHGCVRMSNRDVADLFERVEPGDLVVVA